MCMFTDYVPATYPTVPNEFTYGSELAILSSPEWQFETPWPIDGS